MAVTTSFSFLILSDMTSDFDGNVDVTALGGGGVMTSGDNPFSIVFPPITVDDIDVRPYDSNGAPGSLGQGSAGGVDASIDLLSSNSGFGFGTRNVVTAFEVGNEVHFSVVSPTGTQVVASTAVGDTDTSNPDVVGLAGRFVDGGGGLLTWTPGGFAIAFQDQFGGTDRDIQIDFFTNGGADVNSVTVDGTDASDTRPSITQLDNGNVAVAWTRDVGPNTQVMFAIYNRDGTVVVQPPTILDSVGLQNRDVAIVATDAGFAVLYEEIAPGFPLSTRTIKLASVDGDGDPLGSRVLLSRNLGNFNDIAVTRLPDGLLAFSYTGFSGIIGSDTDILVHVAGQAHDSTILSSAYEVIGGGSGTDDAIASAIAAFNNGQLAVIYDNDTTGSSDGETLRLTRVHTSDAASDTMTGGTLLDSFVGGDGIDTVNYSALTANLVINLGANTASGGTATGDTYSGIENILAGTGNDALTGSVGNDGLNGGDGNDTLSGGNGDDRLNGGAGDDTIFGGDGNDRVNAGAGNDSVTGDAGNDRLKGGAGDDAMLGNEGDDRLNGGGGADSLAGGNGDDKVNGGIGDDQLMGGGQDDVVLGRGGNDMVNGGKGADRLLGGTGDDTLTGANGADTLSGEGGNDFLFGGKGPDVFLFRPGFGNDTVVSFQDNLDKIDLGGGLNFGDVNETAIAGGVQLTFDGQPGLTLDLLGITPLQLDAGDFI